MAVSRKVELNPPHRILLGPGPSNADPRVLRAMAMPPIGHLDPFLMELLINEQRLLRSIFRTSNEWTFALSGTGTSGMEAALANLIERNDKVLVAVNGYFGARLFEIANRLGAQVDRIDCPPGNIFLLDQIESSIQKKHYKLFAMVHAETSTGAKQLNIQEISRIVHEHGALFILDTVTSLAGIPVEVDGWEVDIAYSASQKNLSTPSGLAPITVSPRAQKDILNRSTPISSFYLDLKAYARYWGEGHLYHHTTSANLHYALFTALKLIEDEGLAARFERILTNAKMLWEGLERLECHPFVPIQHRLPVLTTAQVPSGVNAHEVRNKLLSDYNIEIAAGFGDLKDKVWRIGLMGFSSSKENVALLLKALEQLLG